MFSEKELRYIDIVLLIFFPIAAVLLSVLLHANYFLSTVLFFIVPSIYLSFRTKHMILKTLLFSLLFSVPFTVLIDTLASANGAWEITRPLFAWKVLGLFPLDDFVWAFFHFYFVIIFYEHFLHKGKHELVDKRLKYVLWPLIVATGILVAGFLMHPELLNVPYAYLWIGLVSCVLPTVSALWFFPRLASKYIKVATYFFMVTLLFELTALQLNQWAFPSKNFIGWVELFGHRFPFEELIFWMVLSATAIISYYEFFDEADKGNPLK